MKEGGYTILESLWSLMITSVVLAGVLIFFSNLSRSYAGLGRQQSNLQAALKTRSILGAALRTLERNRLPFAVTISSSNSLVLPNGERHPIANLGGASTPRRNSDIISLLDVAPRFRGDVRSARITGESIEVTVCNLQAVPAPGEFKSYLLHSISGSFQVTGALTPLPDRCILLSGAKVYGLVSPRGEESAHPLVFIPIEREYSLFVDKNDTLRLASHVANRITENQPLLQGVRSIHLTRHWEPGEISTFTSTVQPLTGPPFTDILVPALAGRFHWNEVLL